MSEQHHEMPPQPETSLFFPTLTDAEVERYGEEDKKKVREIYNTLMERHMGRIYITYQNLYLQEGQTYTADASQILEFNKFIEQTHQEMLDIARTQFRLEKGSETDNLTHLLYRDPFAVRYEIALDAVQTAENREEQINFAFIDLDHFKRLNETYGHGTVDLLLARVGQKINESIRPYDAACRHGGDEITLFISHVGPDQTKAAMERLYEALSSICIVENDKTFEIYDLEKDTIPSAAVMKEHLSLSIGVKSIKATDSEAAFLTEVTREADMAVFKTKHHGRGGITFIEGYDSDNNPLGTTFQYDRTQPPGERFVLKGTEKEKMEIERGVEVEQLYAEIVQKLDRTLGCLHSKGYNATSLPENVASTIKNLAEEIHGVCYT